MVSGLRIAKPRGCYQYVKHVFVPRGQAGKDEEISGNYVNEWAVNCCYFPNLQYNKVWYIPVKCPNCKNPAKWPMPWEKRGENVSRGIPVYKNRVSPDMRYEEKRKR